MTAARPALIVHGHFYQPPRENPWTGAIDPEPEAYPFPHWNERIHHECYRANGWASLYDERRGVERAVNNYARISFNCGPTLFDWWKSRHPDTYARVLQADRESLQTRRGHGNAIAQAYSHAILPLCNERDRRTQLRWGTGHFRASFGREPEALWLPETACNDETLEALIEEGLRFAILAPRQAERVGLLGTDDVLDVSDGSIDPSVPYQYFHRDGSGRSIVLFFYHGALSRAIAFEDALGSSSRLMDRVLEAAGEGPLVHLATDGETYGHHQRFGDLCLAHALEVDAPSRGIEVTNYAEFLDRHPPRHRVELKSGPDGKGTSWSCSHGVGRWFRDCGCRGRGKPGWTQAWRGPLRAALDYLNDEAARLYEEATGDLFHDPWALRDAAIELFCKPGCDPAGFLQSQAARRLGQEDRERTLLLLELQRHALLMQASCGWFFSDISGVESLLVLKQAGRVLELIETFGSPSPRERFLGILAEAHSNRADRGNGADLFRERVEPCRPATDPSAKP